MAEDGRDLEDRIRDLYLVAFSREPTEDEQKVAVTYIRDRKDQSKKAFEDVLWALMNTKEFVFNH